MGATWFHVDLDAFFAAVELLDDPSLAGKPVIVGARPGGRGVVSTSSYEARAFGVHSAMPIGEAYRRCPSGVFLPVRMERYLEVSEEVMAIFRELCPEVRTVSIDEAFLDMSGMERLLGEPAVSAALLKSRVRSATGLTISVGVASNRFVAKIASGLRKPDGLVIVPEGGEEAFMLGLPLSKLWGAGEKTQERFADLGILSMEDLAAKSEAELARLFGEAGSRYLHAAVRGRDLPFFEGRASSRSMSTETTFETDLFDRDAIEASLLEMSVSLLHRLRKEGLASRTLTLKLRLSDFSTASRRCTRDAGFADSSEVFADAKALLARLWNGKAAVRLVGLAFADLEGKARAAQAELFAGDDRRQRLEDALVRMEDRGLVPPLPARLVGKRRRWPPGKGHSAPTGQ